MGCLRKRPELPPMALSAQRCGHRQTMVASSDSQLRRLAPPGC